MQALKREPGLVVIKFYLQPPLLLVMATVTFLALFTFVNIILMMTVVTTGTEFFISDNPLVAILTSQLAMIIDKFELGVPVMLETCLPPLFGRMAGFAFRPKAPLVLVVIQMT